jgi:putative protein-disulfide isomerase
MPPAILFYAYDPMCSWCWAFRPAWLRLQQGLPPLVRLQPLLGGLAPDDDLPMAPELQLHLQATWRRIQQRVPGTQFNFDFWTRCRPRRSTYPACRAVIAAREQAPALQSAMILAIQEAYYLQARNPSDLGTLAELASEIGLDADRFRADLRSASTDRALRQEIGRCRALGLSSFPSLALETATGRWPIPVHYTDTRAMLAVIDEVTG